MDISAILKNSSEGQWKTIEGEAKVKLISLTPGEFSDFSAQFTDTKIVEGKPVSSVDAQGLYEALFVYCAKEWEKVESEDGKPYPIDDESKRTLYRAWWPLFRVFKDFIDNEVKNAKIVEVAQEKN